VAGGLSSQGRALFIGLPVLISSQVGGALSLVFQIDANDDEFESVLSLGCGVEREHEARYGRREVCLALIP